jgi:hypothetical protein
MHSPDAWQASRHCQDLPASPLGTCVCRLCGTVITAEASFATVGFITLHHECWLSRVLDRQARHDPMGRPGRMPSTGTREREGPDRFPGRTVGLPMTRRLTRATLRLSLLLALLALSACSHAPGPRPIAPSSEADRLVRDADAQIRAGQPSLAVPILDDVVRRFPDASVHDQALYELARALVLSANGSREYRRAAAQLDRLLREHPTSAYTPDAKAWRSVLNALLGHTAERERLLERLRAIALEFERLKAIDLKFERARQPDP